MRGCLKDALSNVDSLVADALEIGIEWTLVQKGSS
jgi:hypothetical protein